MSVFTTDHLRSKVVLVTGGGTGIGKEIARTLGRHGARVLISSRKNDVLQTTATQLCDEGIECLAVTCDIRDPQTMEDVIRNCLARFGQLDILVNNAAGNFPARIEDLSYNAFRTIVDIDLQGTFNMSKAAFSLVMREHGGVIINIVAPFEHVGVAWQAHAAARYGTGQDIADAVMFLASNAARFISGVNLCVDGATSIDMLKVPVYPAE